MKDKKIFKATNDKGVEIEYEIITMFKLNSTNKNYLVYTDNTFDEKNNINIYAAIYYPNEPTRNLEPIESDFEWAEIEKVLSNLGE